MSGVTELMHMTDCYVKENDAKVIDSGQDEAGFYIVVDKTCFYPEGGGQESDTGWVEVDGEKIGVKKVTKKKQVKHYLERPVDVNTSDSVKLILDWDKRYALMRMHTAQHIISAIALKKFGSETVGNQIHSDYSRLDFRPSHLTREDIKYLEEESNKVVDQGLPVEIKEVERKEAEKRPDEYRCNFALLPKFIIRLRVVSIQNFDNAICAGTHVANTKEVGKFKILRKQNKGKNTERIVYELVG